MKLKLALLTSTFFLAAGLSHAAMGRAIITGTADGSTLNGTVLLEDTKDGLQVSASFENAPVGDHGFHIHQFGNCGDGGKAAGGHYNPKGVKHGLLHKDGLKHAHVGDLGNVTIGKDGKGELKATLKKVSLSDGKFNVGGRAFILHEKPDDFGQPTGNAGGRIGCGPIVITE